MATDCVKREERSNQAVTEVKELSPETDRELAVNLFHGWGDSSLGYDTDGLSIHERSRGLRPRQVCEQIRQELGRSLCFLGVHRGKFLTSANKHKGEIMGMGKSEQQIVKVSWSNAQSLGTTFKLNQALKE